MKAVSLEKLREEHAVMKQRRDDIEKNLVMHDGALQTLEQLIILAEKEEPPAGVTKTDGTKPEVAPEAKA